MKFRHNGQTLSETPEEILQQIKEESDKEYEFRYNHVVYTGTEFEIKRKLVQKLRYDSFTVGMGLIFLGEEEEQFDSKLIRTRLISKALSRVEQYCLDPRNEI